MIGRSARWLVLLLAPLGCEGSLTGPGNGGSGPFGVSGDPASNPGETAGAPAATSLPGAEFDIDSECKKLGSAKSPGKAPLRRLTRAEYDNTVAELLNDSSQASGGLPPEARALGFYNNADAQSVTSLLVEGYKTAAEGIAGRATANVGQLLGCPETDATCVDGFIQRLGSRAYRRPLLPDEAQRLRALYDWGVLNTSAKDGVQMVLELLLQSPDFLYRPELGAEEVAPGVKRISSHEMATRLSYLLRGSMPDQVLLDEAAADRLKLPEQIRAQAERLLREPRAREAFKSFHSQWLDLERVLGIERDAATYGGYSASIPALLEQETKTFVDHVIWEADGKLGTLLTAPYTFLDGALASFYGMTAAGGGFSKVPTDPSRRMGLLTQGSLLSMHAQPLQTSPVNRGVFVRESLLCQTIAPPPANLAIVPPDLDPKLTTRQRFAQHSVDPACAGCHVLMDPVGLGFEHFDAVGRWRDNEQGLPIDATGSLVQTDVDGAFNGAVELAQRLSTSLQVADCVIKHWGRFAYGRGETTEDACSLDQVRTQFTSSQQDIKQLALALTQTDAFLYRKAVTP